MTNSRQTSSSPVLDQVSSPTAQAAALQLDPDDRTSLLHHHAREMAIMNNSPLAKAERRRRRGSGRSPWWRIW